MKPTTSTRHFQSLETTAWQISNHWKLLAIAGALALSGCGDKVQPGHTAVENGIAVPANAATVVAKDEPFSERLDVMGTVASAARVQISAKLSAHVEEVFATAGQAVTNGQLLVKLDDRDLQTQLAAAESQLVQAATEKKRVAKLFEQQAATEQMKTAADAAASAAMAQAEHARVALSWAEVRSPLNGIVTDKQVDGGDLANPGQIMMSVYDPKQLRLEVAVPARLIPLLKLGDEADISVENPARQIKARVEEIVSEADPVSRTQKVKIRLPDGSDLRPGQFGRLWISVPPQPAMFVPASAIYRSGQLEFVQVAKDGRAERRLVKTGRSDGQRIQILSGLEAGEQILVKPVM